MTPQQQAQQQQQQEDYQLMLAGAAVLATAITVPLAVAALAALFLRAGIRRSALQGAIEVVMSFPPDRHGMSGPATRRMIRLNLMRRAQFVVASARRLNEDLTRARSHGTSQAAALKAGIARERRYYAQHLQAIWNRMNAAAAVDSAASEYGLLLGWYTVLDSHTSPECKAANRKNFRADDMPIIGYPGAVHPHCRCYPGAPVPGAAILPSVGQAAFRTAA